MVEQFERVPGVLRSYQIDLAKNTHSPIGHVFEIADRSGDNIERGGCHQRPLLFVKVIFAIMVYKEKAVKHDG